MADELPTAILKRVMSKPETHGDEKKSKKMMGSSGDEVLITDGEAAAAIDKIMLEGTSGVGDEEDEEDSGVAAPFPNVHVKRELSNDTTHSSLSDGEGGGGRDIMKEGDVVKVPTFNTKNDNPSNNQDEEVAASSPPSNNNNNNKSIMTRQVSHDGSEANRSRSSSSSENGNRPSSVGNWGWFEDVHGHESAFLPGLMGGNGSRNASRDNSMNRNRRGSTDNNGGSSGSNSASKKKKGGLLHIGSELMSNVIQAFNEPQRGKSLYFVFFILILWL